MNNQRYHASEVELTVDELNSMKQEKLDRKQFIDKCIKIGSVNTFGDKNLVCMDMKKKIKYTCEFSDCTEAEDCKELIINVINMS